MFSRNYALVATVFAVAVLVGAQPVRGEDSNCYTTASVAGSWAVVATYGANVAEALATRTVAGDGYFTGIFLLNGPTAGSPTGARTITTGNQIGVYAVNCDGTGTVTRTLTASNGVTTTQVDDFVITKSVVEHGRPLATAIADAQRVPSALVAGGIFVTRIHTRLAEAEHQER